jgi:hypothetical protein
VGGFFFFLPPLLLYVCWGTSFPKTCVLGVGFKAFVFLSGACYQWMNPGCCGDMEMHLVSCFLWALDLSSRDHHQFMHFEDCQGICTLWELPIIFLGHPRSWKPNQPFFKVLEFKQTRE